MLGGSVLIYLCNWHVPGICHGSEDGEVPHPPAPAHPAGEKRPAEVQKKRPAEVQDEVPEDETGEPIILHVATLSRNEKDKIKRIVTPKATTGRLEVPQDIFDLWKTPKGKEKLFALWCKSGGVKDSGMGCEVYNFVEPMES